MEQKTIDKIKEWSEGTGRSISELNQKLASHMATFASTIPNKTPEYYEGLARQKLFMEIKSELMSPAKPVDMIVLGYSSVIETTATEMEEKEALWKNPETRNQAVFEKKVSQGMTDVKGKSIPDGTPLDTRQWFTPPNAGKNIAGRKNPGFGKPLRPSWLRTIVGFGRPSKGGQFRLAQISANNEQAKREMPPIQSTQRSRLTLKNDKLPYKYVFNTARSTQWTPIEIPEYPSPVSISTICEILKQAPTEINPGFENLLAWHNDHSEDKQRLVVFEGDVAFIAPEPTANGSIRIILTDASKMDMEAEGVTLWVSKELRGQLDFGANSHVIGLARTNLGDAWDREANQADPTRKVVQLAVNAIFAEPAFRTDPEEESVISGEDVQ